jgi:ferric-dicitrate binding protein FerR (iron transport regulator)
MPYKNPEHKRQWEREHREHRNAQRRNRRSGVSRSLADLKRARELGSTRPKETKRGWKSLIALAIGLGAIVLGAMSGINTPLPPDAQGPNWPE